MERLGAPRAKLRWRVFKRRYREELELHAVLLKSWQAAAKERAPKLPQQPSGGAGETKATEGQ